MSTPPRSVDRRAWINVVLAAWLVTAVVLIARLNTQGIEPQSQRSIYVVPAYAGLTALAIYVVVAIGSAVRHRRPWQSPFTGATSSFPSVSRSWSRTRPTRRRRPAHPPGPSVADRNRASRLAP